MITVPFRRVVDGILARCQTFFDVTDERQRMALDSFLNARFAEGWTFGPWPEWTVSEQRAFAEDWSATTAYAVGDVVWVESAALYYQALTAHTGQNPVTKTADWAVLAGPIDRLLLAEATGKTALGRIWSVTNADVEATELYRTYAWQPVETGIRVCGPAPDRVWVRFGRRAPEFSARVWEEGKTFARGDVVMAPDDVATFKIEGDCYRSELDQNAAQVWVWVPFPAVLERWVVNAVASDMQRQYGKVDEADGLEARGYVALNEEARKAGIEPARVVFRPAW